METVEKPWGHYKVLHKSGHIQIKELVMHPNSSLSLQSHEKREEHWFCYEGAGVCELDGKLIFLSTDMSVFIPRKSKHRLTNDTETILKVLEVQIGDYLGEDDIIRYEDKYGRV